MSLMKLYFVAVKMLWLAYTNNVGTERCYNQYLTIKYCDVIISLSSKQHEYD